MACLEEDQRDRALIPTRRTKATNDPMGEQLISRGLLMRMAAMFPFSGSRACDYPLIHKQVIFLGTLTDRATSSSSRGSTFVSSHQITPRSSDMTTIHSVFSLFGNDHATPFQRSRSFSDWSAVNLRHGLSEISSCGHVAKICSCRRCTGTAPLGAPGMTFARPCGIPQHVSNDA